VAHAVNDRRPSAIALGVCRRVALALPLAAGVATSNPGAAEVTMDRAEPRPGASTAAPAPPSEDVVGKLPSAVSGWTRKGPVRTVPPSAIFEYMDGAGELYLAYRLERLKVVEYASEGGGDILVELYRMASSDDAFGLLSGDWGGEPVTPGPGSGGAQWPRALYGSGLLRIWSGNLYARVLATRESDAARSAVLALGRAIAEGRATPPAPRLCAALPATAGVDFRVRRDRLCFFRSHLVLNSIYFLGQRDMLDLGPAVEAVVAPYERGGAARARATVAAVRYPTPDAARRALTHFRAAYLPEAGAAGDTDAVRIEDGWVAYGLAGRSLALVFEAPDRESALALLSATASGLVQVEGSHE